jgi:hypothetical protein
LHEKRDGQSWSSLFYFPPLLEIFDYDYWLNILFKVADGRMIFRAFSASGR